jgi:hypothetical protein
MGLGLFGEIRACGSGFRTEEMLVRDFVRGRSDKRSPAAPVRELQAERWVVPEGPDDGSQAIYCLGCVQKGRPSRRDGVIKSGRTFFLYRAVNTSSSAAHTVPTGRIIF